MRPSSRNCNPAPDLVLSKLISQPVFLSGGVFMFTDTGRACFETVRTPLHTPVRRQVGWNVEVKLPWYGNWPTTDAVHTMYRYYPMMYYV